jgi:hypothetical protein
MILIEVSLKFDSYAEAAAVLLALGADTGAGKPTLVPGTGKSVRTGKPADGGQPANQAQPTPAAAASVTPATTPAKPALSSPTPTASTSVSTSLRDKKYPETGLTELINQYAGANKEQRGVAKQVIEALGATKGPELKPEVFDVAHAAFTKLIAGASAEVVLAGLRAGDAPEDAGLG